VDWDN
jgi:hypothetical protein